MRERSKLPVLLTELTIMLLIFSLCAAVCLSLFFSSKKTAEESGELSRAAAWAQSAAEVYVSAKGDIPTACELLGGVMPGDGGFYVQEDGARLTVTETGEHTARVEVVSGGAEVFAMDVRAVAYG